MGKESCFFPLGKRGLSCLFPRREGRKLPFPLGRRGVAFSPRKKATPFIPREKGIKLFWKAPSLKKTSSQMFDKKVKGQNLFKSNIIYTIGKLFKSTYLKWSCIIDLRLWIKSYDKKKNQGSNVQVPFSPREKRLKLPSPPRKKGLSCHGE